MTAEAPSGYPRLSQGLMGLHGPSHGLYEAPMALGHPRGPRPAPQGTMMAPRGGNRARGRGKYPHEILYHFFTMALALDEQTYIRH